MLTSFSSCDMIKPNLFLKGIFMMARDAYPRPELVRENFTNLCGQWEFEFDFGRSGRERELPQKSHLERTIHVPFCPESKLSGIGYRDFIGACWYRKTLTLTPEAGQRVLLHFEAAYHTTEVYLNGMSVGVHRGGYTPFCFDITEHLRTGENVITVCCEGDPRSPLEPSGKQSDRLMSYGCMYTRCTGIYAPVWLEVVPDTYLASVKLDPDPDNSRLFLTLTFCGNAEKTVSLEASLYGRKVGAVTAKTTQQTLKTVIDLEALSLWSPESPTLYDLDIQVSAGSGMDKVRSYFGMRKIELDGVCLRINGKRVFQRLVLDQGYYPDGIYTAPNEDAFRRDIELAKRLGFNGARLHERVFDRRFLYEADRLGYLVWGEYANWGFDHTNSGNLGIYLSEWVEAVSRDYNHPALIGWCPFNETWDRDGRKQEDSLLREVYRETKRLDPMRPVIDTSGNYHVATDIYDVHDYCQDIDAYHRRYDRFEDGEVFENRPGRQTYNGQPYMVSEYGGIRWSDDETSWGYGDTPKSIEDFVDRYVSMIEILMSNPRICGVCYTQLYDVEQEQNGLYRFDRTPKFDEDVMARLAAAMQKQAAVEEIPDA